MVIAAAAIPLLVWYAADAILNSADGDLRAIDDPTAPGYEARVDPSPSHMVLSLDPSGALSGVAILSLGPNNMGGTVLSIPAETITASDVEVRLIDVYEAGGELATRQEVASLMDINVDDHTVLDELGWRQIVSPAAPVPVDTSTDLTDIDGVVVYAQGTTDLEAATVSEYLGWVNPGEGSQGRVQRQVGFWKSWTDILAASDNPAVIPGERSSGFPWMLAGLTQGQAVVTSIAGTDLVMPNGEVGTQINVLELRGLVNTMIPFPRPTSPGARPKVRLLDGVGGVDVASLYSPALVAAGAEIVIIGNASSFDVVQTVIVYHDERFATQAEAFGVALNGAVVSFEPIKDAALDVTIVMGEDQEPALG